jgi:CDP-diacylglycerol--glycerol-3-phosphate 3-phosphatidyltransferase
MFRVAMIFPFMYYMQQEINEPASAANAISFWIFALATITDYIDGILARRWNLETPLGRLLDPLADKLLVSAALIMLAVYHGLAGGGVIGVPAWAGTIIIARELAVTGLRAMASAEGIVIAASSGGKWKTVIQFIAIGGLILQGMTPGTAMVNLYLFSFDLGLFCFYALWVALALTAWSGIAYFREFITKLV